MINILYFISFLFLHEFYVSISYMEYDSERKAIEVQKKIFFDDFEIALKKKNNLDKFDILNSKTELVDNYIEAYLKENVSFEVNDKVYDILIFYHVRRQIHCTCRL